MTQTILEQLQDNLEIAESTGNPEAIRVAKRLLEEYYEDYPNGEIVEEPKGCGGCTNCCKK